MAKTATRQEPAKPTTDKPPRHEQPRHEPPRNDPPRHEPKNDRPTRDTREDPAPNPDAGENQPDTAPHQDVEKLRRNLKR